VDQDFVREGGDAEARMNLSRGDTAADLLGRLEDEGLQAGLGEIEGSGEAVLSGANYNRAHIPSTAAVRGDRRSPVPKLRRPAIRRAKNAPAADESWPSFIFPAIREGIAVSNASGRVFSQS